jgi:hypothetical protein
LRFGVAIQRASWSFWPILTKNAQKMAKNSQNDQLVTQFLKDWLYQTTLFQL